jgi:hypothetical protein
LAAIITFLEFAVPTLFLKLAGPDSPENGLLPPLEFVRALLADEEWWESGGTSA